MAVVGLQQAHNRKTRSVGKAHDRTARAASGLSKLLKVEERLSGQLGEYDTEIEDTLRRVAKLAGCETVTFQAAIPHNGRPTAFDFSADARRQGHKDTLTVHQRPSGKLQVPSKSWQVLIDRTSLEIAPDDMAEIAWVIDRGSKALARR